MKNVIFFAIFGIFLSGCQFVGLLSPVVTGIVIWKDGRAYKYYDLDQVVVCRAIKRSCGDIGMRLVEEKNGRYGRYMLYHGKDSLSFYIKTTRGVTEASLRVNTFGNKPLCEMIFEKIDSNICVVEYDGHGKPVMLADPSANTLANPR